MLSHNAAFGDAAKSHTAGDDDIRRLFETGPENKLQRPPEDHQRHSANIGAGKVPTIASENVIRRGGEAALDRCGNDNQSTGDVLWWTHEWIGQFFVAAGDDPFTGAGQVGQDDCVRDPSAEFADAGTDRSSVFVVQGNVLVQWAVIADGASLREG